ncbi:heavy metal translocating P-type ATPase metal-binding domain-containing protein [Helicobacter gastrofelis]|uniref:heavy metal translocating P-type ATPase metal-binding domain-containing protein n=1 Tax=Helicobacter gastrofelis TaxID=2849642 RepID=UPI0021A4752A|nr:heavy metal translocating P-type ATPase metal-binding domain-containing protein [Helicobacter sp. NHP19-012]
MPNCTHCKLPCQNEVLTLEQENTPPLVFCCAGCKQVYTLLHDLQLESFYDKLGAKPLAPIAPQSPRQGALQLQSLFRQIHHAPRKWATRSGAAAGEHPLRRLCVAH